MDLVVSGSSDAILMVECGANGVTEAEVLDALDIAHEEIKKICAALEELRAKAGKEKLEIEEPKIDPALVEQIRSSHGAKLDEATQIPEKLARQEAAKAVEEEVLEQYASGSDGEDADPSGAPRSRAPSTSSRRRSSAAGSRSTRSGPTGAPRTRSGRSSARSTSRPACTARRLFTRGETQILSNVALGTSRMDMRVDNLSLLESKTFWHHYNFPPFSVGEAGFMRGPKRRDIGHGALAERALVPTIPSQEDFPYVIRVVSETLESNGSSSMGSVCASSMALMAAGVPVSTAGRRRGDGADQGGRRPRRAHRHRRRRGPPRRHGLQGRRHVRGDHRPADGHQDLGGHLRHPSRRARAGAPGTAVHPRQDGRGDLRSRARSCRSTRRGSSRSRSTRRRSAP